MPECGNCDAFVTADFARVFSDPRTGDVGTCVNCTPYGEAGPPKDVIERRRGSRVANGENVAGPQSKRGESG